MGAAALASISALIGGAALAVGALNSLDTGASSAPTPTPTAPTQSEKQIVIVKDRFGQVQQTISEASGGGSSSIQTNYGSNI